MANVSALVQQILGMLAQILASNASQFPAELALGRGLLLSGPMISPTWPPSVGGNSIRTLEPTSPDGGSSAPTVPLPASLEEYYRGRQLEADTESQSKVRHISTDGQARSNDQRFSIHYQNSVEPKHQHRQYEMARTGGSGGRTISTEGELSVSRGGSLQIQQEAGAANDMSPLPTALPTQEMSLSNYEHGSMALPITRLPRLQTPGNFGTKIQGDAAANSSAEAIEPGGPLARDGWSFVQKLYENDISDNGIGESGAVPPGAQQDPMSAVGTMNFLDQARLGRWILDYLAKEASRPNAGMTGADPRITPAYPGAPFGV